MRMVNTRNQTTRMVNELETSPDQGDESESVIIIIIIIIYLF